MIENITNEKVLDFTGEKSGTFVKLTHSPEEYIEQVKKMENTPTLIKINIKNSQKFYEGLKKLVKECDDNVCIKNIDKGRINIPNKNEFLKSEEIIDTILSEVNPEWSTKQKVAYVHYKMGEIVSYYPDWNFAKQYNDAKNEENLRNTPSVLSNGLGVCDGITFANMSILSRLGIDSEAINAKNHTYLCVKTEEGNIITDPTWDLFLGLFKGKPMYFGKDYNELIASEGTFSTHLAEKPPENVLSISEQELRGIYTSIGIAGKDGKFPVPIMKLVDKVNDNRNLQNKKDKLEAFFSGLYDENGENFRKECYHTCEFMDILGPCISRLEIGKFDYRCVYKKDDIKCEKPILIFHSGEEELRDNIYLFPKKDGESLECMDIKEFDEKFKIHNNDNSTPFWEKYIDKDKDKGKDIDKENTSEFEK